MRRLFFILLITQALTGCTGLFFYPSNHLVRTPADIGLKYEELYIASTDGTQLHAWWLPAQGEPHATIVFFHGNAQNISTHIGSVHWLPEQGFNVLLVDYRGYGKSAGRAVLKGIIEDADSTLRYAQQMHQAGDTPLIVFGQSLGGAIAVHTVAHAADRQRIAGLVVESAFNGYRQIAQEKLASNWLTWPLQWPLALTINDDYSPIASVAAVSPVPLLLIYSAEDQIVPAHHGDQLFEAAKQPKAIWHYPNGRHIALANQADYRQRLTAYLISITK